MSKSKKNADVCPAERSGDVVRAGAAFSTVEVVDRFGNASAEYIKGYAGVDNETGQKFAKGLKGIAEHKVNPAYADQNIKQQAGYSAEVAATSRDNAQAIIKGSKIRASRADDLPQYGKNHNVIDRVQIINGEIVAGSQSQMKFVGNRDDLFRKIAKEDGKFARYRGTKIELPSEQYEGAAEYCRKKAETLRTNANAAEKKGNLESASSLRKQADNYENLAKDVCDSGMTTDEAVFYRQHPKIATALDIALTSHKAGMEGVQYGAAIGGSISLIKNIFAVVQDEKNLHQAVTDLVVDSSKAAAMGYGTAFVGSALKAGMKQSGSQAVRILANTSAPVLVVNVCLSLGGAVKRYVQGDITESQFLIEVGEQGAGMLSGGMMAALGQLAVPIPFVGAAIGGMVGYALSTMFYQSALDAARGAEASHIELARVRAIETVARENIAQERAALDAFMRYELPQLYQETLSFFAVLDVSKCCDVNQIAAAINDYAMLLGRELQFQSQDDFDDFMSSDQSLQL